MNFWSLLNSYIAQFISIILLVFPSVDQSNLAAFTESMATFRSYIATARWFFPVNTFMNFITIMLSMEFVLWTKRFWVKIINLLSFGLIKL